MIEYGLINLDTSSLLRIESFSDYPGDVTHKGFKWLIYTLIRPPLDANEYKELPPEISITETEIIETYTQVALTQQEKDERRHADILQKLFNEDPHLGKILLYFYNKFREQENLPASTREDFINFIDTLE